MKKFLLILTLGLFVLHAAEDDPKFANRNRRYRLHPGNTISTNFRYSPEYNSYVMIQPDGYASFPNIGTIKIGGLTVEEATRALMTEASKTLHDPEIVIDLKGFEQPYVVVGGEVQKPGKVDYYGDLTVLRAIELAGGVSRNAKTTQVLLVRPIDGEIASTRILDLRKILVKHDMTEDITLQAGDTLVIPVNRLAKIERIIKIANVGAFINPTP